MYGLMKPALVAFLSLQYLTAHAENTADIIDRLEAIREDTASLLNEIAGEEDMLEAQISEEESVSDNMEINFEGNVTISDPDIEGNVTISDPDIEGNSTISDPDASMADLIAHIDDNVTTTQIEELLSSKFSDEYEFAFNVMYTYFNDKITYGDDEHHEEYIALRNKVIPTFDAYKRLHPATDASSSNPADYEPEPLPLLELEDCESSLTNEEFMDFMNDVPDSGENVTIHTYMDNGDYVAAKAEALSYVEILIANMTMNTTEAQSLRCTISVGFDNLIAEGGYGDSSDDGNTTEAIPREGGYGDSSDDGNTTEAIPREGGYGDSSDDGNTNVQPDFDEILNTIPDETVREFVKENIQEGNIDEAEQEFEGYVEKYISELPADQMDEAEKVESQLKEYASSYFESLRANQKVVTEGTKEDMKAKIQGMLDEIDSQKEMIDELMNKLEEGS